MDPSPDFTEAADELYGLPPGEFVAARDAAVARAREQRKPDLGRALAKLRRPTQSAWLVNLLVRESRGAVDDLLALAPEFQRAYQEGAGQQLREVSTRRQRLVAALVRDAERLADAAGVRLSADAARDVEGTFGAALVDPDVAEEVLAGRLTSPVQNAGFGPGWIAPAPTGASVFHLEEPAETGKGKRQGSGVDSRRAGTAAKAGKPGGPEAAPRQSRAEARLAEARAGVDEAERELATRDEALQAASESRDEVRAELDQLRAQLRDTEERLAALDRGVRAEAKRRQRAADALRSARRSFDQASRRVR
jgi:hypothetical protein